MSPKDIIRRLFGSNDHIVNEYLKDFGDAELLMRPVPEANHIAWQLGHLINAEVMLLRMIPGTASAELPAGWADQYTADRSHADATTGYLTKAEYLDIFKRVRANSVKALDAFPEVDLDKPSQGRLSAMFPKLADIFVLIANHPMMHVGQFVVMRRKLGKPVVI
jgi:hypothetical protein